MLRMLRGGQRWLTALFVVGIGGVFVLFLGLQGPMNFASSSRLVAVGPYAFDVADFERVRQRRESLLAERFGGQLDSRALRETVDNMAVQELVDTALLALAAEELGLQVTKREIERLVLSDPAFRDESGRFDREQFQEYTEYYYGSEAAFVEDRRLALLSLKMLRLLNGLPEVSSGEAREALRAELAEVRVATVVLEPEAGDGGAIADEAVAKVLAERPEDVRALYAERAAQYDRPERVRARHILISVPRDATPEQAEEARQRLVAAGERIAAGEDFETVAEEVSEDPGSAFEGGDLGFFARGQMVGAFEDAAFALAPGEISEPVRSDFGWHLIRSEERQDAMLTPYEDAREELARALLAREAAREAIRERAEALAARLREGEDLEALARAEEIDLRRSGWLRRSAGATVPGLGPAPELLAAAFALEPGESADEPLAVGDRLVLLETLEKRPADPELVEQRLDERRETLLAAKRDARIGTWLEVRRDALVDAGELMVDLSPLRGS